MKADQSAKKQEEDKLDRPNMRTQPVGLHVCRKSLQEWSCKLMESNYEIVTQVGEGAFRYLTQLTRKHGV
jgi:hypothetical protein